MPVLRYRYWGQQDDGKENPWFDPVDAERGLIASKNLVTFSLENFLDARMESKKGKVTYQIYEYMVNITKNEVMN